MISAVVLAAGLSTRMGEPKLLRPVRGRAILQRVLDALRRTDLDEVVVVLGAESEKVRREVKFEGEKVVLNRAFADGMSTSLKLGLKSVNRLSEAVVVALGDQPFLSPSTVDRMVEAYLERRPPIVVPVVGGVRGNPVLFAKSVFPDVMKIEGDVGAKSVVEGYGDRVLELSVQDSGVLFDIDTPADYERALTRARPPRGKRVQGATGQRHAPRRRFG